MLVCLCCTYRRAALIPNVLAMWAAQRGLAPRHLLILDDAPNFRDGLKGDNWSLVALPRRIPEVGAKFDYGVRYAIERLGASHIAIFDDDDVYLPLYVECHVRLLAADGVEFSLPRRVFSNSPVGRGNYHMVPSHGGYHPAWAFSAELYQRSGGYPLDMSSGMDIEFRDRLFAAKPRMGDPWGQSPQFIYRWMTASHNDSAKPDRAMQPPEPDPAPEPVIEALAPCFDQETYLLYAKVASATA
jgi:hypothetical protein